MRLHDIKGVLCEAHLLLFDVAELGFHFDQVAREVPN